MSLVLGASPAVELLSHVALYGCAAIAEDAGVTVRVAWTEGMDPGPRVDGLDAEDLGQIVVRHAQRDRPWLAAELPHDPSRGLFSPRIKSPGSTAGWEALQQARHDHLDRLDSALDAAFLAALGEPAYWYVNRKREVEGDRGASRYEMQPRNQGSEFVGSRLRPLAAAVAARDPESAADGITGRALVDDFGARPDSRTGANLRPLGPTDGALAWCALWGISALPVIHRSPASGGFMPVGRPSRTAGHVPRECGRGEPAGAFVLPLFTHAWSPARLRHVLASRALADAGRAVGLEERVAPVNSQWLENRGVKALVRFPIITGGSTSAPERRAMRGLLHRL